MTGPPFRCAALVLAFTIGVFAQRNNFKEYGQAQGLTNLDVCCLLQDRTGFLWVGTDNGLFRYDGRQFRSFTTAQGLPASQITALHLSAAGEIWVGTAEGLARWDGDRFQPVTGPGPNVLGIESDAQGNLYVGTATGLKVGSASGRGGKLEFRQYTMPGEYRAVYAIKVDGSGRVWLGCGMGICNLEGGQVRERKDLGLPSGNWRGILIDRQGSLWLRSLTNLVELPKGAAKFERRDTGLPHAGRSATVQMDRDGVIYVPTALGLAMRTGTGWTILRKANGLPSAAVDFFLQDQEGSAWIALDGGGLVRWLGYKSAETWTESEGFSHDVVWSLARDSTGELWASTQAGLSRFLPNSKVWQPWKDAALEANPTLSTAAAADGSLWIAQVPGGLFHFNPRTGFREHLGVKAGLYSDWIYSLLIDSGTIWAGTAAGLYKGVQRAGTWRFSREQIPGPDPPRLIQAIVLDRQKRLWLSSGNGISRRENGKWTHFGKPDGLLHNNVTYLTEAPDGSLWAAYRDPIGISRLEFQGDRMRARHYGPKDGLRPSKPYFLRFDRRGWLWLGTDTGIDRFDGRSWVHLDKSDGLAVDDCDHNSFYEDRDGSLWIGTSKGLTHFLDPASAGFRSNAPHVVLTRTQLGGTPSSTTGEEVPYSRRSFDAGYAALSFVNEDSMRFRHRLLGLDPTWTETRQIEAHYPGLWPGYYTLEVQASAVSGEWSAETARSSFRILPPWWLTWWALAADVLLLLLTGRLLWAWRVRSILSRQNELERAVEDRTRKLVAEQQHAMEEKTRAEQEKKIVEAQKVEIERLLHDSRQAERVKSEFLANISHEVRTPLNGIMGMTELVLRSGLNDDQSDCLRLVKSSADGLLLVINDVLDFSKIEAGKLDLDNLEFSPAELLRECVVPQQAVASAKGLELRWRLAPEMPARVTGDAGRLRQVLTNLIGNAIKFTEAGSVDVEVLAEGVKEGKTRLYFQVRDSGIGIPAEKQALIFEPFRQADGSTTRRYGGTGLGLAICQRLTAMMDGRIWLESHPGKGSTFHFTATVAAAAGKLPEAAKPVEPDVTLPRAIRILLAEDNPVNQKLTRRLLESSGSSVTSAVDGLEAIEAFKTQSFDLVLMDIQMPRMDGFEATAEIRRLEQRSGSHIPIVALTANAMAGDRERCLHGGMDAYISKPVKRADLFKTMAALLGIPA